MKTNTLKNTFSLNLMKEAKELCKNHYFLTLFIVAGLTGVCAWITHVCVTFVAEQWIFLIVGAALTPIGVIHGIGYWFGAW